MTTDQDLEIMDRIKELFGQLDHEAQVQLFEDLCSIHSDAFEKEGDHDNDN